MPKCLLCNNEFELIGSSHLKYCHNTTIKEYLKMFPDAELRDKNVENKMKGRKVEEETRKQISNTLKGHKVSEETRKKISEAKKGKKLSPKTKEKMKKRVYSEEGKRKLSEARKGRKVSAETGAKISQALTGRKLSPEHIQASKEGAAKARLAKYGPPKPKPEKPAQHALKGKPKSEAHKQALRDAKAREDKNHRAKVNGDNRRGKPHSLETLKHIAEHSNPRKNSWFCGYQEDLGHYVRSSWERNYALILRYLNIPYEYEPEYFPLTTPSGNKVIYKPDFHLTNTNIYVEIKGWERPDDKAEVPKYELFTQQYPNLKIIVIRGDKYQQLLDKYLDKINDLQLPPVPKQNKVSKAEIRKNRELEMVELLKIKEPNGKYTYNYAKLSDLFNKSPATICNINKKYAIR